MCCNLISCPPRHGNMLPTHHGQSRSTATQHETSTGSLSQNADPYNLNLLITTERAKFSTEWSSLTSTMAASLA